MKEIKVEVTFNVETGACKVSGPINAKGICIAALCEGIKAIVAYVPPVIQPAILHHDGNGGQG